MDALTDLFDVAVIMGQGLFSYIDFLSYAFLGCLAVLLIYVYIKK